MELWDIGNQDAKEIHIPFASEISMEGTEQKTDQIVLPAFHELLTPLVSATPLQLIANYAAKYRGCDIDKSRNLEKIVTLK